MNTKTYLFLFAALVIAAWGVMLFAGNKKTDLPANVGKNLNQSREITEKVYVAMEGDGVVAVINAQDNTVIKNIDLTDYSGGKAVSFMAHNVQVAPNGKSVWVAANAMIMGGGEEHSSLPFVNIARAEGEHGGEPANSDDQLIVINPETDTIVRRIPMGKDLHLAHVTLTPDSLTAVATSQTKGLVYKVNATTFEVEKTAATTEGAEPHGLRISPDGKTAYIAMVKGKSIGMLDMEKFELDYIPLDGAAVQAGVTTDGKYAFASTYDIKSLAVYDRELGKLSYIRLPSEAKGPVQMYGTPDSQYVYMVDQGYYFDQPISDTVYKIDLKEMKVVKDIKAGQAPHGIVVSKDGKFVYVTNLLSGDVSVIDAAKDVEIAKIKVGSQPNGISVWSKNLGGTN